MTPQRTLKAIAALAESAAVGWSSYESTEAALAASTIPGKGDGRGADVSDPTSSIASSHERYYGTVELADQALALLRTMQRTMRDIRKQHPETARQVDAALKASRCSGDEDPFCVNLSVAGPKSQYAGLCHKCIKRRQRAADEAA